MDRMSTVATAYYPELSKVYLCMIRKLLYLKRVLALLYYISSTIINSFDLDKLPSSHIM